MGPDKKGGTQVSIKRKEIMPGVFLNFEKSDKFKTTFMSITLLNQLERETAAMNALIPFVLKRGTRYYPDMESLSSRLDELYGTSIDPMVRRNGEVQGIGLAASFPEEKYLPGGATVTAEAVSLICEMLLSPNTRGGLLISDYVESEKTNLINYINSLVNNKRSYALTRCIEEMCCFEDIAIGKWGRAEDVEAINYKKLTKHYHTVLQSSPIEIFFFGQTDFDTVESMLLDNLSTLPRAEINYDIGTDIRLNAIEDKPRYFEENLDVTQGKLVLGYRLGEAMEDPDIPALQVFNAVFGSGVTSKLFVNVREKMQLCYYASSLLDFHKGILLASSGIDFDKFEPARDEIIRQLDFMREGEITDDEMNFAKAGIISDLRTMADSQYDMEAFCYANTIEGIEWTGEELAELVKDVTREDVVEIARSLELDLVYFLRDMKNDDED